MNIYVSYYTMEKSLAEEIKRVIENYFRGVSVFVSCCPDSLTPGEEWLPKIKESITKSKIMLLICSQSSLVRPWINFEAGCGWIKGKIIIPIYHSGVKAGQFQLPTEERQGLYLEDDAFVTSLFDAISKHLKVSMPNLKKDTMTRIHKKLIDARPDISANNVYHSDKIIYKNTKDLNFVSTFMKKINNAKNKIVLVGTGIEIIVDNLPEIEKEIKRDRCNWEIFMANPFCTAVEMRLLEEETGSPQPPVGKQGLIARIPLLLNIEKTCKNLEIKLFSHYPTISMFIIDDDYFCYSYGFSKLGNYFSPVSHYSAGNSDDSLMTTFLQEQYEIIKLNSVVDAHLIYDLNTKNQFTKKEQLNLQAKLVPFAVYLVPDEDSEFYRIGSEVLGYDLRSKKTSDSKWPEYVKTTSCFGFHLTIVDALYFAHEFERDMVIKEIRWLVKKLGSFELTFHLVKRFPDDQSISLVCTDKSGILEILHHEMVRLCYKRAIASNYSPIFGEKRATPNRNYSNDERNSKMMDLYHAPYIMHEFRPHFSLLSGIPADKIESVFKELEKAISGSTVAVSSICILSKSIGADSNWEILEEGEIPLG